MQRFISFLAVFTVLSGTILAGTAVSAPISFSDTVMFHALSTTPSEDLIDFGWGTADKLDGLGDYVSWAHHFTFDPPAAGILDASLTLSLRDDGGFLDLWEFAVGWTESGEWDIGEVNTGTYGYSLSTASLMDGEFKVTLASLGGDFHIDASKLEITYEPVPEPGSGLLLGLGLLSLAGTIRKKTCVA